MKTRWVVTVVLLLALLLPGASLADVTVVYLEPTGGDDSGALTAAMNSVGPGGVVELAAAQFQLSAPVVVTNFGGTLRGQGSDKTVIGQTPGVPMPLTIMPPSWGSTPMAIMFLLTYDQAAPAELRVEGLTLAPMGEAVPWEGTFYYEGLNNHMLAFGIQGLNGADPVSSVWNDVHIVGNTGPQYTAGYSLAEGIYIEATSGAHRFTNVRFENILFEALYAYSLTNGSLTVGGPGPSQQVLFTNTGGAVIAYPGFDNMDIDITNVVARDVRTNVFRVFGATNSRVHVWNTESFNTGGGVTVYDPWWETMPSSYLIEHNTFRMSVPTVPWWWGGVELYGTYPGVDSTFVVRNNRIESLDPTPLPPILADSTVNAVITNNTIVGRGPVAVAIGPWSDDSGMLLKSNNLQGWAVEDGSAAIWLGAGTSRNTIVGGGKLRELVFDESDIVTTPEYDGANILSGVNSAGGAIGAAIRDAMRAQREARQLFR